MEQEKEDISDYYPIAQYPPDLHPLISNDKHGKIGSWKILLSFQVRMGFSFEDKIWHFEVKDTLMFLEIIYYNRGRATTQ